MDVMEIQIVPKFAFNFSNFVPEIEETMCRLPKDFVPLLTRQEKIRNIALRVRGLLSDMITEEVVRQLNTLLGLPLKS